MTGFSEQDFVEKLKRLSNSQQSIQTLAHWIMFHRKAYKQSVHLWDKEIKKVPAERKLIYLYLANDILQNSRKKSLDFVREFAKVLPYTLAHIYKECDQQSRNAAIRVLDIWDERHVYSQTFVDSLRKSMSGGPVATPPTDETMNSVVQIPPGYIPNSPPPQQQQQKVPETQALPFKIGKSNPIVTALAELDDSSVMDALITEKVSHISPELLSTLFIDTIDKSNLAEVARIFNEALEADKLLKNQQKLLEEELEKRSNLINLLSDYIESQENLMSIASKRLQDCNFQINNLITISDTLKDYVDNQESTQNNTTAITNSAVGANQVNEIIPRDPRKRQLLSTSSKNQGPSNKKYKVESNTNVMNNSQFVVPNQNTMTTFLPQNLLNPPSVVDIFTNTTRQDSSVLYQNNLEALQ